MSAHKSIDKICAVIAALTLLLTVLFCNGRAFGLEANARTIGYENRLFDRSRVHSLDLVIDDWDGFLETCESEEYSPCTVIIDGESVRNAGIRGKGNTSLSSVRNTGSSRFSFKIEFDQYDKTKSYHGLDKLCLNNIIQDNTYMKDYLAYSLMYDFGADAPLCSYVYMTVNGEDWGLYLAVEAIEESFLTRNYGSNYGDLYKPDAMSFGGGRGNGKDFRMSDFMNENSADSDNGDSDKQSGGGWNRGGGMPDFGNFDFGNMPDFGNGEMPDFANGEMPDFGDMPSDFDPSEFSGDKKSDSGGGKGGFGGFGGGFGMGSSDVKLQYTDDEFSSYTNIFNSAKTTVSDADKKRLIASLKALSEQTDLAQTVNTDEVLRYFVVHNFLCNGDSYTGQMIHNYYLYEENGQLSMIPWDYNLAFGSFMSAAASGSVNAPIDTPVSGGMSDRPMIAWIFDSEAYTAQYHQLFSEFLAGVDFEQMIADTVAMIDSYVEKDPTKFCTYEEYQKGVTAISRFCQLRAESVRGQLDGTIPATTDGQKADSSALVDTGDLNLSDMGSMGGKGGGFGGNPFGGKKRTGTSGKTDKEEKTDSADPTAAALQPVSSMSRIPVQMAAGKPGRGGRPDFNGQPPEGFDPGNMPEGFDPGNMPEGFDPGNMPEGFDPGNMPEGFDPGNMPEGFDPGNMQEDSDSGAQQENAAPPDAAPADGETVQNGRDSGSNARVQPGQDGRPQPGSFPGMGGDSPADNTSAYILLGISALILLLGIGFALKFRR